MSPFIAKLIISPLISSTHYSNTTINAITTITIITITITITDATTNTTINANTTAIMILIFKWTKMQIIYYHSIFLWTARSSKVRRGHSSKREDIHQSEEDIHQKWGGHSSKVRIIKAEEDIHQSEEDIHQSEEDTHHSRKPWGQRAVDVDDDGQPSVVV